MLTSAFNKYINSYRGLSREVWTLSLVMLINRSGSMVLAFLAVYMVSQLDFRMSAASIVIACFGAGSIAGGLLGGWLTDRVGHYKVQVYSFFFSGLMYMLLVCLTSLPALCIGVFFTSLIADTFRPANMAAVAAYSHPENRARSYALLRLAINLGYAIGPAAGGFLAHNYGYTWLFIIDGSTCIVAGFVMILLMRKVADHISNATTDSDFVESNDTVQPTRNPWRDRQYMLFILAILLTATPFMQILTALPVYFKQVFTMNEAKIGMWFMMNCLIVTFVEMPLVHRLEKYPHPKRIMAFGAALIGLSFIVFTFSPWPGMAYVCLVLITFGEIFNMPFAVTYVNNFANDSNRGRYMSVYSITYSFSHILAALVGLNVAEFLGFEKLWYILFGICILAVIGYFRAGGKQ